MLRWCPWAARPRASIFLGRGDKETAEKILGNCATALVVVGVALTAVFFAFGYQLLGLFGASSQTIGYAWQYFSIYLVGTIFVQASLGLNAFINAQGYTMVGHADRWSSARCSTSSWTPS